MVPSGKTVISTIGIEENQYVNWPSELTSFSSSRNLPATMGGEKSEEKSVWLAMRVAQL